MTHITVRRGDELGEPYRRRITEVLVGGFAEDFAYFSRDPRQLADAFEHMLLLDVFVVALADGEPAGVATVTTGAQECFAPRARELRRHLGGVHGTISYQVIRSQFLGGYDGARDGLAEIGFVATAPAYQGRGVATALLRHVLALPEYDEYVLRDIKDTNAPALGLYRKLGFTEVARRPVRFAKRAGFSAYVSLGLHQV
ncbi:GCN5-related protein N-acetyltransferase [Beutenbergia cavernae DSM 12333]|uniref:GCN5-related protein N-acetyltransferase n=1 Tax=Beutenbergia cavernae (strain ATCC BAA-8 / DSM 12333 / CCUG 43141 / JCM 11478 / NBRC 16432 / NCIMB 13614 / HKI 0122) TaxID=471853 RepID=C5C5A8_BEUC1|nr:GNAT family N-acetyltransferase [Beutenbergia cavernae]ACQ82248.1 GCN5-related protein N-acetyltransferase [Beutenbergia cavernae DSM 12333]